MKAGFTKKRVAEISGLSLRAVQYYTERGLVVPEFDKGEGRGSTRRYSIVNLVELSLIKALSQYGMSYFYLRNVVYHVRTVLFPDLSKGSSVYWQEWKAGKKDGPFLAVYRLSSGELSQDEPPMGLLQDVISHEKMETTSSVLVINMATIYKKIRLELYGELPEKEVKG